MFIQEHYLLRFQKNFHNNKTRIIRTIQAKAVKPLRYKYKCVSDFLSLKQKNPLILLNRLPISVIFNMLKHNMVMCSDYCLNLLVRILLMVLWKFHCHINYSNINVICPECYELQIKLSQQQELLSLKYYIYNFLANI